MNKQHPNLRFTTELEDNNRLPFLDTCVIRRVNKYCTTIYRKKTFTGVYLNWTSLTSRKYKIGLIRCLADRIWKICTEEKERETELVNLRTILSRNDYPTDVVEQCITRYIAGKMKPAEQTPPEKLHKRFIKLPYVGRSCDDFAFQLKKLVNKNLPDVELTIAFQAPMTIGKLFPFKDNIKNVEDRFLVVYSLKCSTCNAEYIGKTRRILRHRLKEHMTDPKSACRDHELKNQGHHINHGGVEILDNADNDLKLQVKECLHIVKRKPFLNKQLNAQNEFDLKTITISTYPQKRTKK